MPRPAVYHLEYAPSTQRHLRAIDSKFHVLIRDKIEEQLLHEPGVATRNRKPLRTPAPFDATWEIRFGPSNRFRVFYQIDSERLAVSILAICQKVGNRLVVGSEEIEL